MNYPGGTNYFEGSLDEVAIYNRTLSVLDIRIHYYLARGYCDACSSDVRIMPLGDSITNDPSDSDGYRKDLWNSLIGSSYNIDFVGSQSAGIGFDPDNEGHPGMTDTEMADEVDAYLINNPPDSVLLHIGTNGLSDPEYTQDIETILDKIFQFDNNITVILARLINHREYHQITTDFNINIQEMADARIANGDKIIVVNHENALIYPNDMRDTLHPFPAGYSKMAGVWLSALDIFLPECRKITATTEKNGNILPMGEIKLQKGSTQTFNITPDNGYQVSDVIVNGVSQGALKTYTFTNVVVDQTIRATFDGSNNGVTQAVVSFRQFNNSPGKHF